jgi:hypothetical protein
MNTAEKQTAETTRKVLFASFRGATPDAVRVCPTCLLKVRLTEAGRTEGKPSFAARVREHRAPQSSPLSVAERTRLARAAAPRLAIDRSVSK